jgi:SAM-dependent methyltransferase
MRDEGHDYEVAADLYDYVVPYRDRPDVAFFVEAGRAAGGRVLELGCGTGRVLIPCARAGIDITGVDRAAPMLEVCRRKLEKEPAEVRSRVELVQGDMREFDLGRSFALVTLPFRPFQHLLTLHDQLSCLGAIRRHLADGGRLILDLFNPWLEALVNWPGRGEFGDEPEFLTPDGRRVTRRIRIVEHDRFAQVNQVELVHYVTYPDGRAERLVEAFSMRYFFRFEAEHLLARAGFEVEHLYADYDRKPYGAQYPGELIFVARKADASGAGR